MSDRAGAMHQKQVHRTGEHRAWGFDVSRFQPGISFMAARASGASFAFLRASTGAEADPMFGRHVERGRGVVLLGSYHALQPGVPARAQAQAYYGALAGADGFRLELPPVADVEKAGIDEALVRAFLEELARLWERRPLIYTSRSKWHQLVGWHKTWAAGYPLWVAHWRAERPALPTPWITWRFWQYDVTAVEFWARKVDVNWFNGTEEELVGRYGPAGSGGSAGEDGVAEGEIAEQALGGPIDDQVHRT